MPATRSNLRRFSGLGLLALAATSAPAVQAQQAAPSVSQPVVQALPSREELALTSALSRLERNSNDVSALIDAGDAAIAMGDIEAATGFYRRAQQIDAPNPRVKAGLASALVQAGDPYSAIPLFDEAAAAGADPVAIAPDRGLAFDLVGNAAAAQGYYRQALGAGANDTVLRRLAVSLAISGRQREGEATLLPLLQKQDKAAWRAKAFSLAIVGETKEAVKITETILPPRIAKAVVPYLQYMPRLTAAQQAAAANLGLFPKSSAIGMDDPRVGLFRNRAVSAPQVASADAALTPRGAPLNAAAAPRRETAEDRRRARADEKARREAERRTARVAPPEVTPERTRETPAQPVLASNERGQSPAQILSQSTPQSAAATTRRELPPVDTTPAPRPSEVLDAADRNGGRPVAVARAAVPAATPARPAPALAASPATSAPPAAVTPSATVQEAPTRGSIPGFDLARLPAAASANATPAASAPVVQQTPAGFADSFGDLGKPSEAARPAAGAVDITKVDPPREAPPPPPPPSHPSRIWVQLGIGQDKKALAFDWRKMTRKAPEAFEGLEAHVSPLNQTNRLLAGPFASRAKANAFVKQLEEAEIDGPYLWSSPAGQVVDEL